MVLAPCSANSSVYAAWPLRVLLQGAPCIPTSSKLVPFGLPPSHTISLSNEGTTPARFYFVAVRCTDTHILLFYSLPLLQLLAAMQI
jgi:hypothetical protein